MDGLVRVECQEQRDELVTMSATEFGVTWIRRFDISNEEFWKSPFFILDKVGLCKPVLVVATSSGNLPFADQGTQLVTVHSQIQQAAVGMITYGVENTAAEREAYYVGQGRPSDARSPPAPPSPMVFVQTPRMIGLKSK